MTKHNAMTMRLAIVNAILTFITYRLALVSINGSPESVVAALCQMFSIVLGVCVMYLWIVVAVNFVVGEE